MQTLADREAILHALSTPLSPVVQAILRKIADDPDIEDCTYIAIICASDSEHDIIEHLGWSPLVHPMEGIRYGHPDFEPYWASLRNLGCWHELIHPVGNDGFAYVLLIEDTGDGELVTMCREHGA